MLVVEDEQVIADLVVGALRRAGFATAVAGDGPAALAAVRDRRPAAVLLDVGLPGLDGDEVCRRLRAAGDWTPVVFVTARDDEVDRVLGLELGADDYVTKPFSPRELVARVRAVLRRLDPPGTAPAPPSPPVVALGGPPVPADASTLVLGPLRFDAARRTVHVGEALCALTRTEFDLLAALLAVPPGHVRTRDDLLVQVWGYPAGTATRTLDVHVAQLRNKLGAAVQIRTVRGVGYAVGVGT